MSRPRSRRSELGSQYEDDSVVDVFDSDGDGETVISPASGGGNPLFRFTSDPPRPDNADGGTNPGETLELPRFRSDGDVISQWNPPRMASQYYPGRHTAKVFGYWHNQKFYRLLPDYLYIDGIWLGKDERGVWMPQRPLDLGDILHSRSFQFNRTSITAVNEALESVVNGSYKYSPQKSPFVFRD